MSPKPLVALVLSLGVFLAGCALPGATPESASNATSTAPPVKTTTVTARGQWSAMTDQEAFVGSGWPGFDVPGHFRAATITVAWTAEQKTGDFALQFAGKGGNVVSSQTVTKSPQSFAYGIEDAKLKGVAFVRLLQDKAGAAAKIDFTVTGEFEVPT